MRANNGKERTGDSKFSQLSIKLILNLTEQLSMHSFDREIESRKKPCMPLDG